MSRDQVSFLIVFLFLSFSLVISIVWQVYIVVLTIYTLQRIQEVLCQFSFLQIVIHPPRHSLYKLIRQTVTVKYGFLSLTSTDAQRQEYCNIRVTLVNKHNLIVLAVNIEHSRILTSLFRRLHDVFANA